MKKQLITVILILQILFNFFLSNNLETYAYEDTSSSSFSDMQLDANEYQTSLEEGTSAVGNNGNQSIVASDSVITSVANILIKFFNILPTLVRTLLTVIIGIDTNSPYGEAFSMQKAIFGQIEFFDIDYFTRSNNETTAISTLKDNTAMMFVAMRNIAIVLHLIILLYMGIRIAISTVAEEKARFKKMIIDWLFSFILLMIIQIVMIAAIEIVKSLDDLLISIYDKLNGNKTIEEDMIKDIFQNTSGLKLILPSILYWVITFYQLKFAYMYFKRVLAVGFLIVISPIVISSYSFDKAGDGQAQALRAWSQEFIINLIIQPVHILLFAIFFITAENIIKVAPILSVILIVCMSKGEKMLRNVFIIKDIKSMESMEASPMSFGNIKKTFFKKKKEE